METIRAIIEVPTEALSGADNYEDALVDLLIEACDSPDVQVHDLVERDEPAWHRSSRF